MFRIHFRKISKKNHLKKSEIIRVVPNIYETYVHTISIPKSKPLNFIITKNRSVVFSSSAVLTGFARGGSERPRIVGPFMGAPMAPIGKTASALWPIALIGLIAVWKKWKIQLKNNEIIWNFRFEKLKMLVFLNIQIWCINFLIFR